MNDTSCVLTIGDFSTLERLHKEWDERRHALAPAMGAKLRDALVVLPDELPADAASLGSRLDYTIDGARHSAVLTAAISLPRDWLPVTLPTGLALLGRRAACSFTLETQCGMFQSLTLIRVSEQPESTWPGRFSPSR